MKHKHLESSKVQNTHTTGAADATLFGKLRRMLSPPKSSTSTPDDKNLRTMSKKPPPLSLPTTTTTSYKALEYERVFRFFDSDGDGKISPQEFRTRLMAVGDLDLSDSDAEAVVELSDSDGDGMLGFEDFVRLVEVDDGSEDERARSLREAFAMYEMEGKGGITPKSLKRMLGRLGERTTTEECRAMIRRFDLNGDGVINFDEFTLMMMV